MNSGYIVVVLVEGEKFRSLTVSVCGGFDFTNSEI